MRRLLLIAAGAAVIWYLWKHQESSSPPPSDASRPAAGSTLAPPEAEAPPAGTVSENMTPDQVRALLGSPDDVSSETLGSGLTRETWTYRNVGKTVVFENGVAVSVR